MPKSAGYPAKHCCFFSVSERFFESVDNRKIIDFNKETQLYRQL